MLSIKQLISSIRKARDVQKGICPSALACQVPYIVCDRLSDQAVSF